MIYPGQSKVPPVKIASTKVGSGQGLFIIAGPCVIESSQSALTHARAIAKICKRVGVNWVYKSSYDKANRSSVNSFRGLGLDKGLSILKAVKEQLGVGVLTDVHTCEEVEKSATVCDVLQIPAFLCRQTDLLISAGNTGRCVNVKKGQFLSPQEMSHVCAKIASTGNKKILQTERGTFFGYNTLVNDFKGIPVMRSHGYPVIFDATHSVQQPGGLGDRSGGKRQFVPTLAMASVAAGVDGVFMEVHQNPDKAPSDGPNMVALKDLDRLLEALLRIRSAVKDC